MRADDQTKVVPQPSLLTPLAVIALATLIGMTVFELVKQAVFPQITIWQSHIATIVLSTVVAVVAGCFVLRRIYAAHQKAISEFAERKRAQQELNTLNETLEQRVAERTSALQDSEQRFRTVFEQAAVGVALIETSTGRFERINQRYCDLIGYSAEQMLNKTFKEITHPDDLQEDLDNMRRLVEGKTRDFSMEKRYFQKDGSIVWVNLTVSPTWAPGEQPLFHIAIVEDITERKRAEEALQDSEQRFRTVFEQAAVGVALIETSTGRFERINQRYCDLIGYSAEQMLNKTFKEITHPDDLQEDLDNMRRLVEGKTRDFSMEKRYFQKDGSIVWVNLTVSPTWAPGEQPLFHIAIVEDITERKELQKQVLEIASEEQRRIGQELHDGTQQELTGLAFFAASLLDILDALERKEPRLRENTELVLLRETADELGRRLYESSRHVQELSQGIMPVQIDAEGLRSALAELASSVDALQNITCRFECPERIEVADNTTATQVYRIAQEAVNNALKHSGANNIRMSLQLQDDQMILEVSDDGVGIDTVLASAPVAAEKTKGTGTRIMRYRAGTIGGTLRVGSRDEGGMMVKCIVPLESGSLQ